MSFSQNPFLPSLTNESLFVQPLNDASVSLSNSLNPPMYTSSIIPVHNHYQYAQSPTQLPRYNFHNVQQLQQQQQQQQQHQQLQQHRQLQLQYQQQMQYQQQLEYQQLLHQQLQQQQFLRHQQLQPPTMNSQSFPTQMNVVNTEKSASEVVFDKSSLNTKEINETQSSKQNTSSLPVTSFTENKSRLKPLTIKPRDELSAKPWNLIWELLKTYWHQSPKPHNVKDDLLSPPYKAMFALLEAWKNEHPNEDVWNHNDLIPVARSQLKPTITEAYEWSRRPPIDVDLYLVHNANAFKDLSRKSYNNRSSSTIFEPKPFSHKPVSNLRSNSNESTSDIEERISRQIMTKILKKQQEQKKKEEQFKQPNSLSCSSSSSSSSSSSFSPEYILQNRKKRFAKSCIDDDGEENTPPTKRSKGNEGKIKYIDLNSIPSLPQRPPRKMRKSNNSNLTSMNIENEDLSTSNCDDSNNNNSSYSSSQESNDIALDREVDSDQEDIRKSRLPPPPRERMNNTPIHANGSNDADLIYDGMSEENLINEIGRNQSLITKYDTHKFACELINTKKEICLYLDDCKLEYSRAHTIPQLKNQIKNHYQNKVDILNKRIMKIQNLLSHTNSNDDQITVDDVVEVQPPSKKRRTRQHQ
jgi:hypothetical protein